MWDNANFGKYDLVKDLGTPEALAQKAREESYSSEVVKITKDNLDYVVGNKAS